MKKIFILVLFCILVLISNNAFAVVLASEYGIATTITAIGPNSWAFNYAVTNINQQVGGQTGLDGFYIQVPSSANITNLVVPSSYSPGGWWETDISSDSSPLGSIGGNAPEAVLQSGNVWLTWWGMEAASVYPIGTTVNFGFQGRYNRFEIF